MVHQVDDEWAQAEERRHSQNLWSRYWQTLALVNVLLICLTPNAGVRAAASSGLFLAVIVMPPWRSLPQLMVRAVSGLGRRFVPPRG
jgi:hypothetical protein